MSVRSTFGGLKKSESACRRLMGLAESQGWLDLEVEEVQIGENVVRWKLTGVNFFARLDAQFGHHGSNTNEPRVSSSKRRKGQGYRHGGS
jgi:hypothetical protein